MPLFLTLRRWLSRDWLLSFLFLGLYLATNRYIYGWDDQHLEIPLLKHLIDPTLYQGDYYVESLAKNFTSFLYPLLSKLISVDQIPAVYFVLFLITRYFLFYWWFKLWHLIALGHQGIASTKFHPKLIAACCVVSAIVLTRTEEFLYRTFSHQEFGLAITFAAIYFFFKNRFILAAALFGLSANFHALYALFPMIYMSVYLLFFHNEKRWQYWLKTGFTFVVFCSPFLIWTLSRALEDKGSVNPEALSNWISLYLLACPQNFPFAADSVEKVFTSGVLLLKKLQPLWILILLYIVNSLTSNDFRKDKKIRAIALSVAGLILACFYFSYVQPNRFVVDLNLMRNEQFLRLFLFGYTTIIASRVMTEKNLFAALFFAVLLLFMGGNNVLALFLSTCSAWFILAASLKDPSCAKLKPQVITGIVLLTVTLIFMTFQINLGDINPERINIYKILALLVFLYAGTELISKGRVQHRTILLIAPLLFMFGYYCYFHYQFHLITTRGGGFWQMQRNWEDMQKYVRDNTEKNAVIFKPYNMEMGGFRIQSERQVLVSYRDCGIVGFDYNAALQWQRRINDVKEFKIFTEPGSVGPAILNAILKYKVDYIVFMRYYAPVENAIVRKIYENEVFALYKVSKGQL